MSCFALDDDFDDFQAAPVQNPVQPALNFAAAAPIRPLTSNTTGTGYAQSQPPAYSMGMGNSIGTGMGNSVGSGMGNNINNMGMGTGMGTSMGGHRPTSSLSQPSLFAQPMQSQSLFGGAPLQPTFSASAAAQKPPFSSTPSTGPVAQKPAAAATSFDDLWSMSLGSKSTTGTASTGAGKSIKDLEKEKATAGLWGGAGQQQRPPNMGGSSFGNFGNSTGSSSSGGDDLLL